MLGLFLVTATTAFAVQSKTISEHVDHSLMINAASDSYEEWLESGSTPEDVFAHAAEVGTKDAWRELCTKLSSIHVENLVVFESEIEKADAKELTCRRRLLKQISTHWTEARQKFELDQTITEQNGFDSLMPDQIPAPPSSNEIPALPNEERVVDASQGPVLIDGGLKHGEIALTFDDGPHPTRTQKILATLKAAGIRATFFEVGEMARKNPQLSRLVLSQGHTVGSHSWSHPNLPKLARSVAEHNILMGHDAVMTATGLETPFFRFPYGAHSKSLASFVQGLKLAAFYWNLDSLDWKIHNPDALYKNVLKELDREKGGIILFHDIQEQTTIVLPRVIRELARRKFKTIVFVPQIQPPKP